MFTMRTDSTHLGPHEGHSAPGLHVLAKPIGPVCDIQCDYWFYLEKHALPVEHGRELSHAGRRAGGLDPPVHRGPADADRRVCLARGRADAAGSGILPKGRRAAAAVPRPDRDPECPV